MHVFQFDLAVFPDEIIQRIRRENQRMGVIHGDWQETTSKRLTIGRQVSLQHHHSSDTDLINALLSAVNIVGRKVHGNMLVQ